MSHDRIAARSEDRDDPMIPAQWDFMLKASGTLNGDKHNSRARLTSTTTPLLVISGDHDLVCPVENWYALTRELPTLHLVVLPRSGHGPQHEFPEFVADYITTFIRTTK